MLIRSLVYNNLKVSRLTFFKFSDPSTWLCMIIRLEVSFIKYIWSFINKSLFPQNIEYLSMWRHISNLFIHSVKELTIQNLYRIEVVSMWSLLIQMCLSEGVFISQDDCGIFTLVFMSILYQIKSSNKMYINHAHWEKSNPIEWPLVLLHYISLFRIAIN